MRQACLKYYYTRKIFIASDRFLVSDYSLDVRSPLLFSRIIFGKAIALIISSQICHPAYQQFPLHLGQ
ncbi:MAG: hypothetical protein N2235_21000 [Fischerella sp.]|nr:hypothetical protein [Fischerella sp.]